MEEKFSIKANKKAKKDLNSKKFRSHKSKILEEIEKLKINPFFSSKKRKIKKLQVGNNIYRLKFTLPNGEVRCIYKIFKRKRVCKILRIGYKENIDYDKYS